MSHIAPFLMFSGERHGRAEEAITFYVSLFADSGIDDIQRYAAGEPGPEGTVKVASFHLNGRQFMASDSSAAHAFNFTPSVSFFFDCETEEKTDRLFHALAEGGAVLMGLDNYGFSRKFGWVNDRFGVSWQVNLP